MCVTRESTAQAETAGRVAASHPHTLSTAPCNPLPSPTPAPPPPAWLTLQRPAVREGGQHQVRQPPGRRRLDGGQAARVAVRHCAYRNMRPQGGVGWEGGWDGLWGGVICPSPTIRSQYGRKGIVATWVGRGVCERASWTAAVMAPPTALGPWRTRSAKHTHSLIHAPTQAAAAAGDVHQPQPVLLPRHCGSGSVITSRSVGRSVGRSGMGG